jgi:hypothetical protein
MPFTHRALTVLLILSLLGCTSAPATTGEPADSAARTRPVQRSEDTVLLEDIERRTFDWFWDTTNPANGLVPDRWPTPSFSSVAAVGFGLTAWGIGAERGYITRQQAAERTLTTLRFFKNAPKGPQPAGVAGYKGFFYHFLDMQTGLRFERVELSTIDTTLLLAGVLFAQSYFDRGDPVENEIRTIAEELYRAVEWPWAVHQAPFVSMGWTPEGQFGTHSWSHFNEAAILNILALGSPTHPISPEVWTKWERNWMTYYGYEHINFGPLFGHQYSHAWIDFRGIQDAFMREKGIDYFENSRRATLSQRAYAIDNPMKWDGYSGEIWGLTACDGPIDAELEFKGEKRRFFTYAARAAAANGVRDDGTIAPTAAIGSLPFAPEVIIPTIRAMHERYGARIYTKYGFLDSFNPSFRYNMKTQHGTVYPDVGWVDGDYLGIDQGPILVMIENHRSGLVWETMKKNPHVVRGLRQAGFTGGWLERAP